MKLKTILHTAVLFALPLTLQAQATPESEISLSQVAPEIEDTQLNRRFTISSGYLEGVFNSNEGLSYFPLSATQLYSLAFDAVTGGPAKSPWTRAGVLLLDFPVNYWITTSLFIPYHEFGHARVQAATGGSYSYTTYGWGSSASMYDYWVLSFYRLFTPPFGFPGAGMAATNYANTIPLNPLTSGLSQFYGGSNGIGLVGAAGGLNNQMLAGRKLADLIYEDNGHVSYWQSYMASKISLFGYSQMDRANNSASAPLFSNSSDIRAILNFYTAKGYGITQNDLETQSLFNLISGTTYALIRGIYDYIASGKSVVRPAEIEGLRIPDLNSYINARGLSYEIVSGYRFSRNLRLDLAYEWIWKGESQQQLTPKIHYQLAHSFPALNDFWLAADLVVGLGGVTALGGSVEAIWTPSPFKSGSFSERLSYFAKAILYNGYTLYGERNSPTFRNTDTAADGMVGIRYQY